MAAPTITWVRNDVGFTPEAAASFRRLEARLGRQISTNSTYRDWNTQMSMYLAWNRYVNGTGPYPGHSRAIHPDSSMHCKGLAMDSNEWVNASFNALAAEYGWIRTAASDPTERHHYEYQWWNDQHRNEGTPSGGGSSSYGGFLMALSDDQQRQVYDALVVNGGAYYKTDALINILRGETAPAIGAIAAGGIMFPGAGYNAFVALANAIHGVGTQVEGLDEPDVDEAELAKQLAPALAPYLADNAATLDDAQLARIATAVADEQFKRLKD